MYNNKTPAELRREALKKRVKILLESDQTLVELAHSYNKEIDEFLMKEKNKKVEFDVIDIPYTKGT
jgi:hypothetical protein